MNAEFLNPRLLNFPAYPHSLLSPKGILPGNDATPGDKKWILTFIDLYYKPVIVLSTFTNISFILHR